MLNIFSSLFARLHNSLVLQAKLCPRTLASLLRAKALLIAAWPILVGATLSLIWLGASLWLIQPQLDAREILSGGGWRSLELPIQFDGERHEQHYAISFTERPGTPRVWNIISDDDLLALTVNGEKIPLDSFTPEQLHDWANGITLNLDAQLRSGRNQIDVVLSNHSGPGGLRVNPVRSDWHHGLLLLSSLPLLLGLIACSRRLSPWISPRHLCLLCLIIAGCAVRVWLVYRYNPIDHIWSDPQRHWEQGTDVLRMDPMSMIDPIMYQLYIGVLAKLTLQLPALVAFYTASLSVVGPWLWYRFLRELQPSRTLALIGWAVLVWLPSWSAIYSYFMQETLMLPLLGGALWATWRCRRKNDTSSFVIAVLIWVIAGLTRGICIPMAAVAMSWLWFAQTHKVKRAAISLLLLAGILAPLSVRSYHSTHMLAPHGFGGLVQLYQRSGTQEIVIEFSREGSGWTYGFTSPGILQAPFEPYSTWRSSRQGTTKFYINLDQGSRSWDEAKASIPWVWPKVINLAKENLIYLFFSESWPDTNRDTLVGEINHRLRWVWFPLTLCALFYTLRLRKQQPERMLPAIILMWFVVQGLFPLSVNEGRYRKPFEGLLIAQCLLLASSLIRRKTNIASPATVGETG